MCDLRADFRLCSCDGETLQDPDWVLERLDSQLPLQHRRGRAALARFSDAEHDLIALALLRLNGQAAFDFAFDPQWGDVLKLRVGPKRWLRFRFVADWVVDTSNGLTGWRSQMVGLDDGRYGA